MKKQYMLLAINAEGNSVYIDDVPNGAKCNCHCADCGGELIAKNNGKIKHHHFAHANGNDSIKCSQTALHLLAKEIIAEEMPQGIGDYSPTAVEMAEELAKKTNPEYTTFTPDGKVIEETAEEFENAVEVEDQDELGETLEEESLEDRKIRLANEIRENQARLQDAIELLEEKNRQEIAKEEVSEEVVETEEKELTDREVLGQAIEDNKDDNWIAARASQIRKNIERDEH